MNYLCYAAAFFAVTLGLAAVFRKRKALASWLFLAGMIVLAGESVFGGFGLETIERQGTNFFWLHAMLFCKALIPCLWISFSLVFARGNYREFLADWRLALLALFIVPLAIVLGFYDNLFTVSNLKLENSDTQEVYFAFKLPGKILVITLLISAVVVVSNFEKTFRAAIGMTRWRVKFLIIGACVLFATKIYILSQVLLYTGFKPRMIAMDAGALFFACCLMATGYSRSGFYDLEIYPSRAVLHKSVTFMIVGGYLILVGILAEAVKFFGGSYSFLMQAFTVMVGVSVVAIVVLSDRFKLSLTRFVSRHFKRPEYDFRAVWSQLNQRLSGKLEVEKICLEGSQLVSEIFDVLSTTILQFDSHKDRLVFITSTSQKDKADADVELGIADSAQVVGALKDLEEPFNLDKVTDGWARPLREITPVQFEHGGQRYCVPLISGERFVGVLIVADRVAGVVFTQEELELLKFICDILANRLMNQSLNEALVQARELEAFQSMSAFFTHDLKNAASSLNLTLQNLPKHFDNPEFREDALRGLSKTADRISKLMERLGNIRRNLELNPVACDLNELVGNVIEEIAEVPNISIEKKLDALPTIKIDYEQVKSVVTNLILNAQEAVRDKSAQSGGIIIVSTKCNEKRIQLSVEDDGCGMQPEFIKKSLFRPFKSTKKQGLGIGMFQSRIIVESHGGTIQVESKPNIGTTFYINLPLINN